ncbi:MAG: cupin domain-containing protein [Pseudomonadota bacterium]
MTDPQSPHIKRATDIAQMPEKVVQHQFNDNAVRHTRSLTPETGMQRIGVHLVRLEPGRDSTTHHFHDGDEEFIYVLEGRGTARIGDEYIEIGAGDFMGFPAPSPAHSMHNSGEEDLVYLMGGEANAWDTVHYPDQARSMIKSHGRRAWFDWEDVTELPPR